MSNLTNEQKAIYAILADNVYWDVRSQYDKETKDYTFSNWTPAPDGWTVLSKYDQSGSGSMRQTKPELDGFTARVFKSGNEIVISYAGTYDYLNVA